MGLLINLLTFPLAPVRGVVWVAEQIAEATDRELLGEEGLRQQIEELEGALERGEIDDAEFEAAHEELLERLLAAHNNSIPTEEE